MVANPAYIGRRNPALTGAHWLMGAAVTLSAAVVATVLAIVFAATMAVITVIVGGALAAWAVAFRLRRRPTPQPAVARPVVLEARKVGHAWVAYGWDQSAQ
jgi:heme/copper-type cytochrome/quinol oxidase subunit 2